MDFGFYVAFHYITPIVNGNKIDLGKMKANLADLFFFPHTLLLIKCLKLKLAQIFRDPFLQCCCHRQIYTAVSEQNLFNHLTVAQGGQATPDCHSSIWTLANSKKCSKHSFGIVCNSTSSQYLAKISERYLSYMLLLSRMCMEIRRHSLAFNIIKYPLRR